MTFSLEVFPTTGGATPITTITEATRPHVVIGSPEIVLDPPGEPRDLRVSVVPDRLGVTARQVLRYSRNGVRLFSGVVLKLPHPSSSGVGVLSADEDALEVIEAVGLRHLVTESVVRHLLIDTPTDIAFIAREFAQTYCHPAVTPHNDNFPALAVTLPGYAHPEAPLDVVLDDLASRVPTGARWWVDVDGYLHFKATP